MDRSARNRSALCKDDNTLGILNLDNLKGRGRFFGDLSTDSCQNSNYTNGSNESGRHISDRLNNGRIKALEALQNSQRMDLFKKPHIISKNKENFKCGINLSSNTPSNQLNHTDYVPFRRPKPINISDLVTDETINIETSSLCPSSASKDTNVSFEPSEITGRSTLYNKDINIRKNSGAANEKHKSKNLSVNDILASSFALKARNLCESLQGGDITLDSSVQQQQQVGSAADERQIRRQGVSSVVSASTACSSFTSFNGSRSLPRTADMSLSKNTCSEESFNGGFGTVSFGAGTGCDESGFSNEEFQPGELMQSKLVNDEISWAQEYTAMPAAALSEQAKAKVARSSAVSGFDSPFSSNSMIAGDPNFSLGNFFNMRSENIWNIVNSKSPNKCRTPVALVDEEDQNTITTTTDDASKISITPKIDNKTYTRVGETPLQTLIEPPSRNQSTASNKHESKDSGNSSENSYLLSLSAIDRALCNLDNNPDASSVSLSAERLMQGKKSKSCMNSNHESTIASDNVREPPRRSLKSLGSVNTVAAMILENKENLDPEAIQHCSSSSSNGAELSDTMSFTESLLNSSDMKLLQRSTSHPRSPLSPIDVIIDEVMDGEEADNDELPGTPITKNRRMRRSKSPRDMSHLNAGHDDSPDATTPVNSRQYRSYAATNNSCSSKSKSKVCVTNEPKSLSSTRLDGCDRYVSADSNFAVSPNVSNSHHNASSLVARNNSLHVSPRTTSPSLGLGNSSSQSSPNHYLLPQVYSPTSGLGSPNPDATTNSDRHLLSAGAARKVISSPVGSEASSSSCSYGTMQTYRSAMSAGTSGRSVSRCSSSSEFSHRDGKQVPVKVTNTELSWGSVKLRSDSRKSMQIKNIINKRLVIRIEASGPGFQIVNYQRSNTVTLQSQECRSISISFCPTVRGVAIGKLSFFAPSGASTIGQSFLDVPLYGYGGNASVITQNIIVGPVGNPFVRMGDVCELAQPLERTVSFYNKGPLQGFAVINIDSIGLMMPRLSDAFEIFPRKVLIPPNNMVDVRIVFKPKREEIKKIIKKVGSVLTLANMRVICGDEANRQRIRQLLARMGEEERSKLSSPILDMLWTKLPNEVEMTDLNGIRENPNVAMELASGFRIHEILLTINHENMDETGEASSLYLPDVDETVLFRTVCHVDSPTPPPPPPPCTLGTVDEMYDEVGGGGAQERAVTSTQQGSWSVSPNAIDINFSRPQRITLLIQNNFKSRQYFEVVCNHKQALSFTPCEGYVAPDGGQTVIDVGIHAHFQFPSGEVFIMVYMENERITVPVTIHK